MTLKNRLKRIPAGPGVYIMKGAGGGIIYIGKAVNLKNRVRSYFTEKASASHFAGYVLKEKTRDIDWIITSNELEALILEANLVRKHRPRYNVMLKDDKHFPYIKLTASELFPRIIVTRKVARGADLYFGPYTDARAMRGTIEMIYKVFRIRDCSLDLPLKKPIRPCLTYHIKRCDAPCANLCSVEEYGRLVDETALLLNGRNRELVTILKNSMKEASQSRRYEDAARIRDQINDLELILEKQKMDLGKDDVPRDLVAVARQGRIGCAVLLRIRGGIVIDKKTFELSCPLEQDGPELITHFIKGYYQEQKLIPRELIVSHPLVREENMGPVLRALRGAPVTVIAPARGARKRQIELAVKNARMNVVEFVARQEKKERLAYSVSALRQDLGLKAPPRRIEAFDISHLSGTDTVASLVVFVDGKPKKSRYRKYKLTTVEGVDDFAGMREVAGRRIRRLMEENKPFPDLFLVDGGKGQLGAVAEALREAGKDGQEVIGLAKKLEEVFKPGEGAPLMIPRTSAGLRLLKHIRDESHRFAIAFQRSRRKKYHVRSWLDDIPGVGPKTRQKLLRAFKSPETIRSLPEEALAECVGPALADKILRWNPPV
ncbi:excinuclease ABC subunit UvrC [Fibrobacterota bacterium]